MNFCLHNIRNIDFFLPANQLLFFWPKLQQSPTETLNFHNKSEISKAPSAVQRRRLASSRRIDNMTDLIQRSGQKTETRL